MRFSHINFTTASDHDRLGLQITDEHGHSTLCTRAEFYAANADDPTLIAAVRALPVGSTLPLGGGAMPEAAILALGSPATWCPLSQRPIAWYTV